MILSIRGYTGNKMDESQLTHTSVIGEPYVRHGSCLVVFNPYEPDSGWYTSIYDMTVEQLWGEVESFRQSDLRVDLDVELTQ